MEDCRFKETEKAISEAFFGDYDKEIVSVKELVEKIGIDRATFYRHHRALNKIVKDYEVYILEEYNILMNGVKNRDKVSLRRMYYEMLTFILRNQRVFMALAKKKELTIIKEMILVLEPEIVIFVRIPDKTGKVLKIYVGEVMGLMEDWSVDGFDGAEVMRLLNNIMYLTNTARDRLLPLIN